MSYPSQESAESTGQPVEIYYFSHGAQAWGYTSASHAASPPVPTPLDSVPYLPAAIKRNALAQSSEAGRNTLMLDVPRDLDVLRVFRGVPPPGAIFVTVARYQQRDDAFESVILWSGRVLGVSWSANGARMECESASVSLARNGLRQLYARTCTHVLYDSLCKAVPVPVPNAVFNVAGSTLALAPGSMVPGEFSGGWLESPSGEKKTMIVGNTDTNVTLLLLADFSVGDPVRLYRGCDKTMGICSARFNNLPNYGGFPFIPNKNPFNAGVF